MAKKKEATTIRVSMIGPPRVGKSSVLASMLDRLEQASQETGVTLRPDETTKQLMADKLARLHRIFDVYRPGEEFNTQAGEADGVAYALATEERISYRFALNVQTEGEKASEEHIRDVEFTDIRGEDLTQRQDDVVRRIQESSVILVAIDAVALMEDDGYGETHNDVFNYPDLIHKIMKRAYMETDKHAPQMVLLVPLKCEKYYWQSNMDAVNDRVRETYANLLSLLGSSNTFSAAITPILTLGDVEFSHFDDSTSYAPLYRFRTQDEMGRPHTPAYSPRFCDQPLFYIVAHILTSMGVMEAHVLKKQKEAKKSGKGQLVKALGIRALLFLLFGVGGLAMYELYCVLQNKPEMQLRLTSLAAKIKLEGDGYELIQDSLNIQANLHRIQVIAEKNALAGRSEQ